MNDLSLERVAVINNLKRMGYTLTSAKGVFPLTYQDKDGNKISTKEQEIAEKERIEAEAAAKAQAEAEAAAAAEAAAKAAADRLANPTTEDLLKEIIVLLKKD